MTAITARQIPKTKAPSPGEVRYLNYTDLHYMPAELKNELWMAQQIIFAKRNGQCLVDDLPKLNKYRDYRKLKIDAGDYKKMFDPITPLGQGGEAKYVAADWKPCPIYIHLANVIKAGIEKIPLHPEVEVIDKIALDHQQRSNNRILLQRQFRSLINEYHAMLGLPAIKSAQDPFKYIKSLKSQQEGETVIDSTVSIVDFIRSKIEDEQDLALFNEYIYKGDLEIAFELGIKHYMIKQNKFDIIAEQVLDDLQDSNTYAIRFMTDRITGRPIISYRDASTIYTSPFTRKDGEDITYWFEEYDISFADFVRQLGAGLNEEQLKAIFELNKLKGSCHNLDWHRIGKQKRDGTMIRLGYISTLTQNCDVYAESNIRSNYSFKPKSFDWYPFKNTARKYQSVRNEKHYNVWYSAYYIPPTLEAQTSSDFSWQANYIFDLQKNQDQFRYGNDGRYAKSELIIWKDTAASYMDIVDSFMPKITHLWHRMQNAMVQAIPGGKLISEELIGLMTRAVDDENKDAVRSSKDAAREMWSMIKQTGYGFVRFLDSKGNLIPLDKSTADFKTEHLKEAMESLNMLLNLYSLLTKSLAMSSVREGEAPKPRVSLGGIEASLEASNNGTWFIEKPYVKAIEMTAERCIQFINAIAKETKLYNYWERYNEFKRVVGIANGLELEGIADIPIENIGMSVRNNSENHAQKMDYLISLATELVKAGTLDVDVLTIIVSMDNYKYASVLMIMNHKQKIRDQQKQEAIVHQRTMEGKQADLQIAQTLQAQKIQGKLEDTKLGKEMDMRIVELLTELKTRSQSMLKEQTKNNRIEQDDHKVELDVRRKAAM